MINGRNKRFKTQNNLVTHKNQGLATNFKSQRNYTRSAIIRLNKTKRKFVPIKSRKSFKRPIAIGQRRNNLAKKDTVFQTQHKQHISHTRHNHHRRHEHHKHNRHFTRFIFSPFVFFSYRSLYYPYSYYPGYYPYAYPAYSSFGYSSPAYNYAEPVYSTSKPYGIDSPGWTYLAQGNFQAAINVFAKDIQSFPDAGIPKVGFALASAAAGNLSKGVLAMREAFNVDPDSIYYFYFDEKVLLIIDDLIEKYDYEFQQNNKRPDEAFMVSALHYLKYDYGNAHEAINRAIKHGDKSLSLGNLHRLVDEQFSNEYADEHK
jgi:tetratricopeptide (TPR) repeat protein